MSVRPCTLDMRSVTVRAGSDTLVDNVSIHVGEGEMVGLIGPNGAGKSSLLRTIYRINKPATGRVYVDGKDVWRKPTEWVARNVGAVLQDMPAEFPLTVRDVVAMGRSAHKKLLEADTPHDHALLDAAIALLGLAPFRDRAFRTLSGGERQRVLVARALVQQPRILILDEPTNHLDIHHQLQLLRFLRGLQTTVVAALHDLNLASMFCDRLGVLDQGRLVAMGPPQDVLTPVLLRRVYRIEATIGRHPETGSVWVMPSAAPPISSIGRIEARSA
ncbi:ABC transporter ATP-binding protein [Nitratireductor kimnyeongensis]|uniref:ABC transporter ATP-binding protein n=1 Tax=Nitratireductor kimnyeongensis TaxID=430679 RepID=A0ABW0T6M5_9HYPH|nr:ABC transporter ATP-binding protein [Nitratireductor kimnyeongensis]QZZ34072.1 ABC transporter ATP-binding protein [Nitratireductor kimnyeongensis]